MTSVASGPDTRAHETAGEGCYRLIDERVEADVPCETFRPTCYSGTGWGPDMQHGGPVAGLLARAMERCDPRHDARISRFSMDLLGAVPMTDVGVSARVARPGRRISLIEAEMRAAQPDGTWRPVATARGWRLATQPTDEVAHQADPAITAPDRALLGTSNWPTAWQSGFLDALDCVITGPMGGHGAATVAWLHLQQPLVAGEPTSDFTQAIAITDVANGIGARLDVTRWTFLNTDLTVHLFRPPQGPWFGLEAETSVGGDGIALSSAVLHCESGPVGRVAQNLLVQRRPRPLQIDLEPGTDRAGS